MAGRSPTTSRCWPCGPEQGPYAKITIRTMISRTVPIPMYTFASGVVDCTALDSRGTLMANARGAGALRASASARGAGGATGGAWSA